MAVATVAAAAAEEVHLDIPGATSTPVPASLAEPPGTCQWYDGLFFVCEVGAAIGFGAAFWVSGTAAAVGKATFAVFEAGFCLGHYYSRRQHREAQKIVAQINQEKEDLKKLAAQTHQSAVQLGTAGDKWKQGTAALEGEKQALLNVAVEVDKAESAVAAENIRLRQEKEALEKSDCEKAEKLEQLGTEMSQLKTVLSQTSAALLQFQSAEKKERQEINKVNAGAADDISVAAAKLDPALEAAAKLSASLKQQTEQNRQILAALEKA